MNITKALLTLTLLTPLAFAVDYQADSDYQKKLQEFNKKWAVKAAKKELKEKNKADLEEFKRKQKLKMLDLEYNINTKAQ